MALFGKGREMAPKKERSVKFLRARDLEIVEGLGLNIDRELANSLYKGRIGATYTLPEKISNAAMRSLKSRYERAGWTVEINQEGESNFGVLLFTIVLT